MDSTAEQTDAILTPFLDASEEAEAERILGQLLCEHADPIIRAIVQAKLGGSASEAGSRGTDLQEIPDVIGEIKVKLLNVLRHLRSSNDAKSIGSFAGYIATTSYNACHTFLRSKYPGRTRLKTKLRYVLSHKSGFALWQDDAGKWFCGFSSWKTEARRPVTSSWLNAARMNIRDFAGSQPQNDLTEAISDIFRRAGGPLQFEDLVTLAVDVLGIAEYPDDNSSDRMVDVVAPAADFAEGVEQRLYL
ncbi:MAG: hypothetical protein ACREAC_07965, partial [Blastocatellia bacterium]